MATKTNSNTMHIRVKPEIKERATPVLESIGMSFSDLFNLVLAQVANQRRIPFEMVDNSHYIDYNELPNIKEQLLDEIKTVKAKIYNSTEEMFNDIMAEEDDEV